MIKFIILTLFRISYSITFYCNSRANKATQNFDRFQRKKTNLLNKQIFSYDIKGKINYPLDKIAYLNFPCNHRYIDQKILQQDNPSSFRIVRTSAFYVNCQPRTMMNEENSRHFGGFCCRRHRGGYNFHVSEKCLFKLETNTCEMSRHSVQ